jgi:hypothetical protein
MPLAMDGMELLTDAERLRLLAGLGILAFKPREVDRDLIALLCKLSSDAACPRCGIAGLTVAAKRTNRIDYKCGGCGLAFSVSGTDWRAIRRGRSAHLVETARRIWLRSATRPISD